MIASNRGAKSTLNLFVSIAPSSALVHAQTVCSIEERTLDWVGRHGGPCQIWIYSIVGLLRSLGTFIDFPSLIKRLASLYDLSDSPTSS